MRALPRRRTVSERKCLLLQAREDARTRTRQRQQALSRIIPPALLLEPV
jgi:hypothetical protein